MPAYRNPYHFGLVVGIDRYPALSDLQHAREDAQAFFDWLTHPDGGSVPPDNCRKVLATDAQMPAGVPREQAVPVLEQLHLRIKEVEDLGDLVFKRTPELWLDTRLYYYVSGHGIALDADDAALLMANAGRPDWMLHLSCKAVFNHFLRRQTFRELVMFADCCRDAEPRAPWLPLPFDPTLKADHGGVVSAVCYATLYGAQSFEPETADQRRGYFTEALLRGLSGEAASIQEPIDSNNLAPFVRQRVRGRVEQNGFAAQDPEFKCDPARAIVFRPPHDAPPVHPITMRFGPYAGPVRLRGEGRRVIAQRVVRAGEPWEYKLPTGLYKVEPVPADAAKFNHGGMFEVHGEARNVQL
jgi:hypothetical protein